MTEDVHGAENNRNSARHRPQATAAAIWTAGWRLAFRNNDPNGRETGRHRTTFGFATEKTGWRHVPSTPRGRPILSEA